MKRRLLLLFFALAVMAVITLFFAASIIIESLNEFDWGQEEGIYHVNINDLRSSAQVFLNSGNNADLVRATSQTGYSVLILSLDDTVLYDSDGGMSSGQLINTNEVMNSTELKRSTSVIKYGNDTIKQYALLIINTHQRQPQLEAITATSFTLFIVLGAIFLIFSLIQYLLVYKQILRPFARMEHAACEIAGGNLDTPLLLERHNPFGAFTWAFDMLRNELKLSKAREEAAARTKKELVASLSHDIRTPIASIRACTEYLQGLPDKNSEKAQRYIGVLLQKTDEIAKLTQDLFQHSIMDLDQLDFSPGEYSSRALLNSILEPLLLQYENKIMITSAFPDVTIFTDKQRLAQVFDNIISNSAKYAPQSQIHIQCEVQDGMLLCCLKDFGAGVAAQDLNFLFDKFYRGKNAKDRGIPGSGLGMFTAKYIMDKTSGSIRAWNWSDGYESGFAVEVALKIVED